MSLFSDNLCRLRMARGRHYSQQRVADDLDIKRSTYNCWENDNTEPSLTNLVKLSNYYGISLDRLVRQNLMKLGQFDLELALRVDQQRMKDNIYLKQ